MLSKLAISCRPLSLIGSCRWVECRSYSILSSSSACHHRLKGRETGRGSTGGHAFSRHTPSTFSLLRRYFSDEKKEPQLQPSPHNNNNNDNDNDKGDEEEEEGEGRGQKEQKKGRKNKRRKSKSKWEEEEEDYALYQSYDLTERLSSLSSFSTNEIFDLFNKSMQVGKWGVIPSFMLVTDLQHPLLKKYDVDFDMDDFLVGAKQAVVEMTKAICSEEVVALRVKEETSSSSITTFLKQCLTPNLYFNFVCGVSMTEDVIRSIDLESLLVLRVHMVPVDEAFLESRERESMKSVFVDNGARSFLNLELRDQVEVNRILRDCAGINYPLGSILMQVDVLCKTSEEMYDYLRDSDGGSRSLRRSMWTFEACVSGHVETNWIVSNYSSYILGMIPVKGFW